MESENNTAVPLDVTGNGTQASENDDIPSDVTASVRPRMAFMTPYHRDEACGGLENRGITIEDFLDENERKLQHAKYVFRNVLKAKLRSEIEQYSLVKLEDSKLEDILCGDRYRLFTSCGRDDGLIFDSHLNEIAQKTSEVLENMKDQAFLLVKVPTDHPRLNVDQEDEVRESQFKSFCRKFPRLSTGEAYKKCISVLSKDQLFTDTRAFIKEHGEYIFQLFIIINGHGYFDGLKIQNEDKRLPLDEYCAFIHQCLGMPESASSKLILLFATCYGHEFDPSYDGEVNPRLRVFSLTYDCDKRREVIYEVYLGFESNSFQLDIYAENVRNLINLPVQTDQDHPLVTLAERRQDTANQNQKSLCQRITDTALNLCARSEARDESEDDVPLLTGI